MKMRRCAISFGMLFLISVFTATTNATVVDYQKISDTSGGFTGTLDARDDFGESAVAIGDLDGDAIIDIAVGAENDDDGGPERGAVWILFLNPDGTVKAHQKISATAGGFTGGLADHDEFGQSVACLGDLDGDLVADIAVGAVGDDDGGTDRGAIWILFLRPDGTVKNHQKISAIEGAFNGNLSDDGGFPESMINLEDLDGDGVADLAAGAKFDDDGGANRGAVWVLFLNRDGTVKDHHKISSTTEDFRGGLDNNDQLGQSMARLDDLDGDAVQEIAVGAKFDDDGGADRGALWVLFLNRDGSVKAHKKISDTAGGFEGALYNNGGFGESAAALGDFDRDGVPDVAIGIEWDNDGAPECGAIYILLLNSDGSVKAHEKISSITGGFTSVLSDNDQFGQAIVPLGDMNGDGVSDLVVAADGDDDGAIDSGALYVLFLSNEADAYQQDTGSEGIVSIEAEHFNINNSFSPHQWAYQNPLGTAGDGAMQAIPDSQSWVLDDYAPLNSPRLDFYINFLRAGIHYVWVRGYGSSESNDSIHLGVNSTAIATAASIKEFYPIGTWVWSNQANGTSISAPATIEIESTGVHTINAWMREDGFIFDKLVITTDPAYLPTGTGPVESVKRSITNQPPEAIANGPYTGDVGEEIILDASASFDPDGSIVLHDWDLENDGSFELQSPLSTIAHAWTAPYNGAILLQVTDDLGLTDTAYAMVNILSIVCPSDSGPDMDVDGVDLFNYSVNADGVSLLDLASAFGKWSCP
jgi:hypothetical protein